MKKIYYIVLFLSLICRASLCFADDPGRYQRSSIYSILVNHTEQQFADEIFQAFSQIPVPDKYNDHNLSVVALSVNDSQNHDEEIDEFVRDNFVASRLVAKWFNRDPQTGICNMELIKARGVYNATVFDEEIAMRSAKGMAMLQDAGEALIANTFLLVNEVNYIDKAEKSRKAGKGLAIAGAILGAAATIATGDDYLSTGLLAGAAAGAIVSTIKGFKVKITTHLYQLQWDNEQAGFFYSQCYTEEYDEGKIRNFENNRNAFTLKYIGKVVSKGNQTSFLGIKEEEPIKMVRKACQRAIDENVVDLQKAYEVFRVKSPVMKVDGNVALVPIGMKEGVSKDSKFEVLEPRERSNGTTEYVRVGVIKPVPNKIWDNRFMSEEEGAKGYDLGNTFFTVSNVNKIYPGMLVRQIL